MNVYLGAESMITPLGSTVDTFNEVVQGHIAIRKNQIIQGYKKPATLSVFDDYSMSDTSIKNPSKIEILGIASLEESFSFANANEMGKVLFILSTTKGDIDKLSTRNIAEARPSHLADRLLKVLPKGSESKTVSVACISGLVSVIHAADLIKAGHFDTVVVLGIDLVSKFTLSGFDSFFALSEDFCKPYDKDRKGLNLGEAASTLILSRNEKVFKYEAMTFAGGASSNDANHISGPSRDGEGLVRSIERALKQSDTHRTTIDFISSHGTATSYNDDMESLAFERCSLQEVPVSSFKGYLGHTLGAAGVLELSLGIRGMRQNVMIHNKGLEEITTAGSINVLKENVFKKFNTMLKTASGFGGCNAAGIVKKQAQ